MPSYFNSYFGVQAAASDDTFFTAIAVTHKNNPTGTTLATVQENIDCTPIDQLDKAWTQAYPTEKLFLMRQTYTKYTAFAAGDYLVYDGVTYAVKVVHPYDAQSGLDAYYFLILEQQSGN